MLTRLSLRAGPVIGDDDVEAVLAGSAAPRVAAAPSLPMPSLPMPSLPAPSLREATRERINAAYRAAGGNLSAAARHLGVSRNTVYRAIRADQMMVQSEVRQQVSAHGAELQPHGPAEAAKMQRARPGRGCHR